MTASPTLIVRRERSPLMAAGSIFALILIGLALLDAKSTESTGLVPSLIQLGRAVQLFHGPLPSVAKLPVLPLAVLAWSSVFVLWCVYLWLIWYLRASAIDLRWIVGGAIGLSLLAFITPPLFSTDVFSYAMFGRLVGVYGLNPYLTTASNAAPTDPLMPYLYWHNIASPYGPIWSLISWVVAHGAGTTPLILVLRFKLVVLLGVLLDGGLIYHLVRVNWPRQANWAYLAFAWNPLVLIDGIVVGHNDIVILTLVLISAELLLHARSTWAMVGLTASVLIKYSTMPLVGVALWQQIGRRPSQQRGTFLLRVVTLIVPLTVVTFLPFWTGLRNFTSTLAEPDRGVTNPLWRIGRWAITWVSGGHLQLTNPTTMVVTSLTFFAGWQVASLWRHRRRVDAGTVYEDLADWAQTLVVFLLVWPRIHTWYVLVPIGLVLAAGPNYRRVYVQVLALTVLSYLAYV